jgi:hypothetical protein
MARSHRYDVFDKVDGVELAHDVSAATAAELVGLSGKWVDRLERHVAEYGSLNVGNVSEDWQIRRSATGRLSNGNETRRDGGERSEDQEIGRR